MGVNFLNILVITSGRMTHSHQQGKIGFYRNKLKYGMERTAQMTDGLLYPFHPQFKSKKSLQIHNLPLAMFEIWSPHSWMQTSSIPVCCCKSCWSCQDKSCVELIEFKDRELSVTIKMNFADCLSILLRVVNTKQFQ